MGRAGILHPESTNLEFEFCSWKLCVVCTRDGVYPGCLGPRHPSGEEVRRLAGACALPEALAPLTLRKHKHLCGELILFKYACLGSYFVFTSGSSTVTDGIVLCPQKGRPRSLKEGNLWCTSASENDSSVATASRLSQGSPGVAEGNRLRLCRPLALAWPQPPLLPHTATDHPILTCSALLGVLACPSCPFFTLCPTETVPTG